MKKLLLSLMLLASVTTFGRTAISTWECNHTLVVLYDDNTCEVGEITYDVIYNNDGTLSFSMLDRVMLVGNYTRNGGLYIQNSDRAEDNKTFIVCK
jgi:hypothetical protein